MKLIDALADRLAFLCTMITLACIGLVSPALGWKLMQATTKDAERELHNKRTDYDTHSEK